MNNSINEKTLEWKIAKVLVGLKDINRDLKNDDKNRKRDDSTKKHQLMVETGKEMIKQAVALASGDIAKADQMIAKAVHEERTLEACSSTDPIVPLASMAVAPAITNAISISMDLHWQLEHQRIRSEVVNLVTKCDQLVDVIIRESARKQCGPSIDYEDLEELCRQVIVVKNLHDINRDTLSIENFLRVMQQTRDIAKLAKTRIAEIQGREMDQESLIKLLSPAKPQGKPQSLSVTSPTFQGAKPRFVDE